MKKSLNLFAAAILITSLPNCIAIKSDKYPRIKSEELKISSAKKIKVFADWSFHSSLHAHAKQNVADKAKSDQKKLFNEVIKESDCCDLVHEREGADVVVDGDFYNESSNAGIYFASLSGASFTIIPCWMNSKMSITAKVSRGKMVNDYDIDDSVFFAIWLPFILALPFNDGSKAEENMNKDLYKNLILEIKKYGFFNK